MCYEVVEVFVFLEKVLGDGSGSYLGHGIAVLAVICHVVVDDDVVFVVPGVVVSFVIGVRPVQYAVAFAAMRMQSSP